MHSSEEINPRRMVVSSLWLQAAVMTFLAGFAVLLYLAYRIHAEPPPIPGRVVAEDGSTLFTGDDIMAGQHVFQKYGLMQYGTIFGHGAYLGTRFYGAVPTSGRRRDGRVLPRRGTLRPARPRNATSRQWKQNRFDPESDILRFHGRPGLCVRCDGKVLQGATSGLPAEQQAGLRRPAIADEDEVRRLD